MPKHKLEFSKTDNIKLLFQKCSSAHNIINSKDHNTAI